MNFFFEKTIKCNNQKLHKLIKNISINRIIDQSLYL